MSDSYVPNFSAFASNDKASFDDAGWIDGCLGNDTYQTINSAVKSEYNPFSSTKIRQFDGISGYNDDQNALYINNNFNRQPGQEIKYLLKPNGKSGSGSDTVVAVIKDGSWCIGEYGTHDSPGFDSEGRYIKTYNYDPGFQPLAIINSTNANEFLAIVVPKLEPNDKKRALYNWSINYVSLTITGTLKEAYHWYTVKPIDAWSYSNCKNGKVTAKFRLIKNYFYIKATGLYLDTNYGGNGVYFKPLNEYSLAQIWRFDNGKLTADYNENGTIKTGYLAWDSNGISFVTFDSITDENSTWVYTDDFRFIFKDNNKVLSFTTFVPGTSNIRRAELSDESGFPTEEVMELVSVDDLTMEEYSNAVKAKLPMPKYTNAAFTIQNGVLSDFIATLDEAACIGTGIIADYETKNEDGKEVSYVKLPDGIPATTVINLDDIKPILEPDPYLRERYIWSITADRKHIRLEWKSSLSLSFDTDGNQYAYEAART
jgi:hypothetical protein